MVLSVRLRNLKSTYKEVHRRNEYEATVTQVWERETWKSNASSLDGSGI